MSYKPLRSFADDQPSLEELALTEEEVQALEFVQNEPPSDEDQAQEFLQGEFTFTGNEVWELRQKDWKDPDFDSSPSENALNELRKGSNPASSARTETKHKRNLFISSSGRFLLTKLSGQSNNRRNRIVWPPGALLISIAEFLYSPKTLQRVIMPIILDLQMEYCEALAAGRRYKATCVRVRGLLEFFQGHRVV